MRPLPLRALVFLAAAACSLASMDAQGTSSPSDGFTLFSPMSSNSVHLLDNNNVVVHTWPAADLPNLMVYLQPNGNLLRTYKTPTAMTGVRELAFDGSLVWDYSFTVPGQLLHHDIERLPNGNLLVIVRDTKTRNEAIDEGRDPSTLTGTQLLPDAILEVQVVGGLATVVWEWHAWDHLVQDFNAAMENFGDVGNSPELIDINFPPGPAVLDDWLHINSVEYNATLDQVCLSPREFNEIWVIDHSTTTTEAAKHSGGASGKGGDLLYRWGNPIAYRAGTTADQQLFGQHDPNWIEPGFPGAGNILVYNNGNGRKAGAFSSVEEVVTPVDAAGNYTMLPDGTFGPAAPVWVYTDPVPLIFYSHAISGAVRLPNGNTLICTGVQGWIFEVDPQKNIVWQYFNMLPSPVMPAIFKVRRYEHYLFPSAEELSAGTGGTVTYELVAGSANAGRNYVLLASASGTSPGTLLPGTTVTVPLNNDSLTSIVCANLNTPAFANFLGVFDSTGNATARLVTGPLDAATVGMTVDFAYVLLSPMDFASNAMPLGIVP